MAHFLARLTVPAGTALNSPVQQELLVVSGQLLSLRIFVPPGPRGELYLRLFHRGVQVLPARAGSWLRPDNVVLTHPLDFPVAKGDAYFYLQGASPNANFSHSVDFELMVDPGQPSPVQPNQPSLLSRLSGLLGQ